MLGARASAMTLPCGFLGAALCPYARWRDAADGERPPAVHGERRPGELRAQIKGLLEKSPERRQRLAMGWQVVEDLQVNGRQAGRPDQMAKLDRT